MKTDERTIKQMVKLHNSSEGYEIDLGIAWYTLTREMLDEHISQHLLRKRDYFSVDLKNLTFTGNVLSVMVSQRGASYEITIKLCGITFNIICSCNQNVERLCIHGFRALESMICFGGDDFFQRYKPGGLIETASAHKKHFIPLDGSAGLNYKCKPYLKSVYHLDHEIDFIGVAKLIGLPAFNAQITTIPETIGYIIMESQRNDILTFLKPCLGKLGKTGTFIKEFNHFIKENYSGQISREQEELVEISYATEQLAKSDRRNSKYLSVSNEAEKSYHLWQQALPVLRQLRYVYRSVYYNFRYLKDKPKKSDIEFVEIAAQCPVLHFELKDKGDFYQLKMKASVGKRELKHICLGTLFFIREDNRLYFLSSLRDAGIAELMYKLNNCLTIFKEHFEKFEKNELSLLRTRYKVDLI